MRLPRYILNKLAQGGYETVPPFDRNSSVAPDLTGLQQSSAMQINPQLPGPPIVGRQDVIDGFGYLNAGLRGISEAHARGQQQDYIQQNTANPLANLAFNDGRSRDVKYGYEQFNQGGTKATNLYDYLDQSGRDNAKDFNGTRKALANQLGIKNYSGTAEQNQKMLGILQSADKRGISPLSVSHNSPVPARPTDVPSHPMDLNYSHYKIDTLNGAINPSAPFRGLPDTPQKAAEPDTSISDYVGMGINYIKRTYNKIMGDDETAVSRIKSPQSKQQYVPPIVTGDTIPDNNRAYHIPEVIDLTRIKAGMRDRGDRNNVQSDGLFMSAFDQTRSTNKSHKDFDPEAVYVGIGPDGSVRAGHGKEFGNDAKLLRFNMSEGITGFSKKPDGQYETMDGSAAAKGHVFPILRKTDNTTTGINLLMKDGVKGNENLYGNITGGRALFTSPDMKKQIVVSGSTKTVDEQLEKFKKDNKLDRVNYIMLDNGSFSRGYRTKDGQINAEDWKDFDRRNNSGGSGVYLQGKGYKQGGLINFEGGGEKRVDKAPADYNFLREENGRKYYNKLSSSQLPEAQVAGVKGGAAYEEFLRSKLASGVSPEELVAKKYIGSDAMGKYRGLYKPTEDIVYTEQAAQTPTPVPTAARRGEPIYGGNRHIAAELFYPSRDSKAITDGGNLNTQQSAPHIKFRNDFGYTGEEADLQADEVQKFLGTTNTFQSPEVYNTLKTRATQTAKMAKGGSAYRNKVLNYLYGDDDSEEQTPQAVTQNTAPTEEEVVAKQPEANQDELVNSILQQGLSEEDLLRKFNPYKRARGVFDYQNNTKSTSMGTNNGFKNFGSYEEGRAALENQLNLYKTGKTKNPVTPDSSLYEAMNVYAPTSDGNDPKHYAEFIAKQMGIDPNQPIRGIDTKRWADAVEKMEGNKKGNNPGNLR